jgi:drug/metabolite transporter (DMT)-like permease
MNARQWGQLLLLGFLWGGSFFFGAVAVQEIAPLTLVFFRVALAAATLLAFMGLRGISLKPALPFALPFLGLALLNNVIPHSLMFAGQTEIGSGLASVLNATTPFWTVLLANALTHDEKLSWPKVLGIGLGIIGTAVMVGPGLVSGLGGAAWAKIALLGTALSYAFAAIFARRFRGLPPHLVATGQLTAATVIMLPVMLATNGLSGLGGVSLGVWGAVAALAIVCTAYAYILFFAIVGSAGATNASLVTLIVPAAAIALGAIFLGERLEAFELAGMALIALGLVTIDGRLLRRR